VSVSGAGHSVWNLYARQNFLLSGDESGRVVLWAIEQTAAAHKTAAAYLPPDSAASSPVKGGGGQPSSRLTVTRLASWSSAMLGSFQCCYLDQVNGNAYVCLTDVSCRFSTLWRVSRRGGGSVEGLAAPAGAAQLPPGGAGGGGGGGEKRRQKAKRRVSMEMDLHATVTNTALDSPASHDSDSDSDSKVLSLENLNIASAKHQQDSRGRGRGAGGGLGNLSVPFQNQAEAEAEAKSEAKGEDRGSFTPASAHSGSLQGGTGVAAASSAGCSRRSSYAMPMFVFPSLLTIQLDFESIATIEHDGVEPSCMRCRVGRSSRSRSRSSGGEGGVGSGSGSGAGKEQSSKEAETCVYLGLTDGSIQKHVLGEVF
jgi:hypothetical protein